MAQGDAKSPDSGRQEAGGSQASPPAGQANKNKPEPSAVLANNPHAGNQVAANGTTLPRDPSVHTIELSLQKISKALDSINAAKNLPTPSDYVNGGLFIVAAVTAALAFLQFKTSEKTFNQTFLTQTRKESDDLTSYIANGTGNIKIIAAKKCSETRGDINYAIEYQNAKIELRKIVDFFDVESIQYHRYSLMEDDL